VLLGLFGLCIRVIRVIKFMKVIRVLRVIRVNRFIRVIRVIQGIRVIRNLSTNTGRTRSRVEAEGSSRTVGKRVVKRSPAAVLFVRELGISRHHTSLGRRAYTPEPPWSTHTIRSWKSSVLASAGRMSAMSRWKHACVLGRHNRWATIE
jgi:hypothetical protein